MSSLFTFPDIHSKLYSVHLMSAVDDADLQEFGLYHTWAISWDNPYANNKGADQPAHPRSLISAFVVRCLGSIIPILAKSKNFKTVANLLSWAGRLESYLVSHPPPQRQVFLWRGSPKDLWKLY